MGSIVMQLCHTESGTYGQGRLEVAAGRVNINIFTFANVNRSNKHLKTRRPRKLHN